MFFIIVLLVSYFFAFLFAVQVYGIIVVYHLIGVLALAGLMFSVCTFVYLLVSHVSQIWSKKKGPK